MKNEWILDVLADLKTFARSNGLPALAEQLADTAELAAAELTSAELKDRPVNGDECETGRHSPTVGDIGRA